MEFSEQALDCFLFQLLISHFFFCFGFSGCQSDVIPESTNLTTYYEKYGLKYACIWRRSGACSSSIACQAGILTPVLMAYTWSDVFNAFK